MKLRREGSQEPKIKTERSSNTLPKLQPHLLSGWAKECLNYSSTRKNESTQCQSRSRIVRIKMWINTLTSRVANQMSLDRLIAVRLVQEQYKAALCVPCSVVKWQTQNKQIRHHTYSIRQINKKWITLNSEPKMKSKGERDCRTSENIDQKRQSNFALCVPLRE